MMGKKYWRGVKWKKKVGGIKITKKKKSNFFSLLSEIVRVIFGLGAVNVFEQ